MNHFALSLSLLSIKLKWIEWNLVIPQISTVYSVGSLQISCVLLIPQCCSLSCISRHAGQEERRAALRYVSYQTRPGAAGTVRQGSVRLKCRLWRRFHVYLLGLPVCLVSKLPASPESFSGVNCGEDGDCWIKKCVNLTVKGAADSTHQFANHY